MKKIIETSDVFGRTEITITKRTIAETEGEYDPSIGPIVYDVGILDEEKKLTITCPNESLARELFNTLNCCADHFTFGTERKQ